MEGPVYQQLEIARRKSRAAGRETIVEHRGRCDERRNEAGLPASVDFTSAQGSVGAVSVSHISARAGRRTQVGSSLMRTPLFAGYRVSRRLQQRWSCDLAASRISISLAATSYDLSQCCFCPVHAAISQTPVSNGSSAQEKSTSDVTDVAGFAQSAIFAHHLLIRAGYRLRTEMP